MRVLLNGHTRAGRTAVEWDGRNESGARVGSGIYFAGLSGAGMRRVVRVPVVR